ncbi:TPA: hypothetical protein UM046_001610 [Stenotrophomonas maltophilia]|uniref:hypothetical protein n=1 Tax=Stenotrophomonas maltophilia TaxID=40324 RepID=UPI0015DCBD93|nr:hypothetical protein [Stenotrophomonas maltophilia]MBW8775481.1 hypothetical protein [Stenotrophomonas sp.]QDL28444.1 hypothetical protein EGM71_12040 [Stenotrophomonas maltophilia]HEL3783851.1 hypothetical protein [Stenotrophomonas maltophilia]
MPTMRWSLMLYLLLPMAVAAQTHVYKCVDGPHPVYQQTPCQGRAAWRWDVPAEQSLSRGAVVPAVTPSKPSRRQRRVARAQGALITISTDAAACERARRKREQALLKRRRLDFVQRRQLDDAVYGACQ